VQTKEGHASPAFLPEEFKYSVVEHPTANLTAWSEVPGVESLTVVLDGRMNGCDLVKEFPGLPMDCSEVPTLFTAISMIFDAISMTISMIFNAISNAIQRHFNARGRLLISGMRPMNSCMASPRGSRRRTALSRSSRESKSIWNRMPRRGKRASTP